MRDDSLPKLVRERLDADQVVAHLSELAASTADLEIRTKGAVAGYSDATTDPLAVIAQRLVAGELVAVQVRFARDDRWWSDTLMRAKDSSYRLVRMREGD